MKQLLAKQRRAILQKQEDDKKKEEAKEKKRQMIIASGGQAIQEIEEDEEEAEEQVREPAYRTMSRRITKEEWVLIPSQAADTQNQLTTVSEMPDRPVGEISSNINTDNEDESSSQETSQGLELELE